MISSLTNKARFPLGVPRIGPGRLTVEGETMAGPKSMVTEPKTLESFAEASEPAMPFLVFDEFNPRALSRWNKEEARKKGRLRRGIYYPTPKKKPIPYLYYRDINIKNSLNHQKQKDHEGEDNYRCAFCLEDFEAKEEVMLTPCSHTFHEDCIVPWLKIRKLCPVCRCTIPD